MVTVSESSSRSQHFRPTNLADPLTFIYTSLSIVVTRFRSLLLLLLLLDQFVDILRLFKSLENEGKETRDSCFTADSISPAFRIIPENRTIDIGRKGGVRFTVVEKGGRVSSSDGDTFTALTR